MSGKILFTDEELSELLLHMKYCSFYETFELLFNRITRLMNVFILENKSAETFKEKFGVDVFKYRVDVGNVLYDRLREYYNKK